MANIVLGVDPGFSVTGYSILKYEAGKTSVLDLGYLKMKSTDHLMIRVGQFFDFFTLKITSHAIQEIALETSFLGKNAQTFLKLGYLRGILYLLAQQHGCALHEFAPRVVKESVTGFGGASKEQVARVMQQLFPRLSTLPVSAKNDVTDALAIGMCGLWQGQQKNLLQRLVS